MKLPEEISVSVKDVPEVIKQFEIANKEIERLNNIINELEKWIKENNLGKYRTENVIDTDELLDKLQELKGDGSNDSKRDV